MFKRAFEDGIKVRVSRYSEIKSVRGATGVIRSGFEYDGRVDVEFPEEYQIGISLSANAGWFWLMSLRLFSHEKRRSRTNFGKTDYG